MDQNTKIDYDSLDGSSEPLVSIIVITYNSAEYILDTLESASVQTYNKIELIVSDDCSTDNTVKLAGSWIKENSHRFVNCILITSPVNTGSPSNCNRGVKKAKGEWIKIIAGDDILLDSCISTFMEATSNDAGSGFLVSDMYYINGAGDIVENKDFRYNAIRGYFFNLDIEKQLKLYARITLFVNSPSFFINMSVLERINFFDEEFTIYDDLPLIFNLLENGIRIAYIDKKTVKYRIYENSLSRTKNDLISTIRINEQIGCFNKYRKKHLRKSNIVDLIILYHFWLEHSYKGVFGIKALPLMYRIDFYKYYLNYLVKQYKKNK